MTNDKQKRCERCGKKHIGAFVWLELDSVSGTYHRPGVVPPERSQGLFTFGFRCARQVLADADAEGL